MSSLAEYLPASWRSEDLKRAERFQGRISSEQITSSPWPRSTARASSRRGWRPRRGSLRLSGRSAAAAERATGSLTALSAFSASLALISRFRRSGSPRDSSRCLWRLRARRVTAPAPRISGPKGLETKSAAPGLKLSARVRE
ncbi:MAG: hypothetical protein LBQ12_14980 [Deltaproteobacteria bacterium]|nr:hypothetical protein [Deltaproteobacteria bacterium]